MPHALLVSLDLTQHPHPPADCTLALHRQVFEWIKRVDPTLAADLHDRGNRKADAAGPHSPSNNFPAGNFAAITVAPATEARAAPRKMRETHSDYFITLLLDGDDAFSKLCSGIHHSGYVVEVNSCAVQMASEPDVVSACTYADLAARAASDYRVRLRFSTPVHFTSGGLRQVLPDPVRIFKGYAERWNAFAPAEFEFDLLGWEGWLRQAVEISNMKIHTVQRVLKEGRRHVTHVGCVGEVEYEALPRHSTDDNLRRLNQLADYAEFCGTGRMVAQGFGQTYRLPL